MSRTLRWICTLLPCAPGVTLLIAGAIVYAAARDPGDVWRAEQLAMAGGAVVMIGLLIGAWISWRIAHPRPLDDEESELPPQT